MNLIHFCLGNNMANFHRAGGMSIWINDILSLRLMLDMASIDDIWYWGITYPTQKTLTIINLVHHRFIFISGCGGHPNSAEASSKTARWRPENFFNQLSWPSNVLSSAFSGMKSTSITGLFCSLTLLSQIHNIIWKCLLMRLRNKLCIASMTMKQVGSKYRRQSNSDHLTPLHCFLGLMWKPADYHNIFTS